MSNESQILIKGWHDSGEEFLALKLKKIFMVLENPNDVALHNDMIMDLTTMLGNINAKHFRWEVARIVLSKPRNFLRSVASLILNISIRNLTYGKKNKKSSN